MPGVRALPEPVFRLAGMERAGFWLDPQLRNAVYGYLAEEDKLPTAAYMRGVVMPGMAAVLHRPPTISPGRTATTARTSRWGVITATW